MAYHNCPSIVHKKNLLLISPCCKPCEDHHYSEQVWTCLDHQTRTVCVRTKKIGGVTNQPGWGSTISWCYVCSYVRWWTDPTCAKFRMLRRVETATCDNVYLGFLKNGWWYPWLNTRLRWMDPAELSCWHILAMFWPCFAHVFEDTLW